MRLGDLVLYNGAARHGVDPVDQTAPLDVDGFTGRLFGLVNFYPNRARRPEPRTSAVGSAAS